MTGRRARRLVLRAERHFQIMLLRGFARRLGVDTWGATDLRQFGLADEERVYYVPSPTITLRRALRRLRPAPDRVFADIGSGKGQALLVAAQLPFGKVVGVELAPELTEHARRNVERARPRLRCQDIELVTADALEWPIPDDLSVAFLYCPFIGASFTTMLERIFASYDANPRQLHIVYVYPWEHNWLVGTGRVAVVDVNSENWPARPGWWDNDHVIVTYEVVPEERSYDPAPLPERGFGRRKALRYWSGPNDTRFALYPPEGEPLFSHSAGPHGG